MNMNIQKTRKKMREFNSLPLHAEEDGKKDGYFDYLVGKKNGSKKNSGHGLYENNRGEPLARKRNEWDIENLDGNKEDEFFLVRDGNEIVPAIPNKQSKFLPKRDDSAIAARLYGAFEKSKVAQTSANRFQKTTTNKSAYASKSKKNASFRNSRTNTSRGTRRGK